MNFQKEKKRLASLETLRSQLLKIVLLFVEAVSEDEENNFGKAFDLYKKARTEIELVSCRLLINPKKDYVPNTLFYWDCRVFAMQQLLLVH